MLELARHWCLNLVVSRFLPVRMLTRGDLGAVLNVVVIPGLTGQILLECLLTLVHDGELIVENRGKYRTAQVVLIDELRCLISEGSLDNLSFGLTERGGTVWENLSKPSWHKLIVVSSDTEELELKSATLDHLMAYLGWIEVSRGIRIDWSSIQRTEEHDHSILYWKSLPVVHVLKMSITEWVEDNRETWFETPDWVRHWSTEISEWYVEPWTRPERTLMTGQKN